MRKQTLHITIFLFLCLPYTYAQRSDVPASERQYTSQPTRQNALILQAAYQDQAKWFQKIPQFNYDSIVFYFDKATKILEQTQPQPYEQLATLYIEQSIFYAHSTLNSKATVQAQKAWSYFEQLQKSGHADKYLQYKIHSNWAFAEARGDEPKKAAERSKPFKQVDLQRAIELTISRMANSPTPYKFVKQSLDAPPPPQSNSLAAPLILNDRIFVKHKDKMVKVAFEDILYLEADRNYTKIFTKTKEFFLSTSLKTLEEKLPAALFLRVHRSFIVHLAQIDEVSEGHIKNSAKNDSVEPYVARGFHEADTDDLSGGIDW